MDFDWLRKVLSKANLGLSPQMVEKVFDFLENVIGKTSENMEEDAYAALGIVGQVQEMKSVNSGALVRCGILLETVLRHMPGLSKESVLEVATRQCIKWREAPKWLSLKIDNVKMAYRVYKKYRAVFDKLAKQNCVVEDGTISNLMAIFWIVFLYAKKQNRQGVNIVQATSILQSLFIFIFAEVLPSLEMMKIHLFFKEYFPESVLPNEEEYNYYKKQFYSSLFKTYERRQKYEQLNLQKLATDQNYMKRFLDDISIIYDRQKNNLPRHSVDQISFLQLDKSITPQAIKRNIIPEGPQQMISKTINFNDDSDDDEFEDYDDVGGENIVPNVVIEVEQPKEEIQPPSARQRRMSLSRGIDRISPFRPLQTHHYNISPIQARHQNLGWINSITSKDFEKDVQNVKNIFETYIKESFTAYFEKAMEHIQKSIEEFTPSCMDFHKRKRSIFCFFSYIFYKIHEKHDEEQRKIIFGKISSYNSILCLSVNLFNFAYQSLQSSYKQYCEIFEVGLIQGQLTINWMGCNIDMPKNLEGYLYDLEKKILIQEIWQQDEGYNLIVNTAHLYQGLAVYKRLKKHADERTQELCESMKIDDKQITKVVNLVRFILDQRKTLLKNHKIDQIIVCSIASILSINRSKNFSLSQIFNHYNRLLHSLNISKSIFWQEGREVDLIDYYNHVFLIQIEKIISNEEEAMKVLDTPIRMERKRRLEEGKLITPISAKFRQPPQMGTFGLKKLKNNNEQGGGNYVSKYVSLKSSLVSKISQTKITDQKDEEDFCDNDMPSPAFGGTSDSAPKKLTKNFSFGDLNNKL